MARDDGTFKPSKPYVTERMNRFPHDCCDDTADLFTHYLFHKYGIDSVRIDLEYYDEYLRCSCGHSWQETEWWLIGLTGDQFKNDPSVPIKVKAVYVGKMDVFHRQFSVKRRERSCGIECLGDGCWERMYKLYDVIVQ